MIVDQLKNHAIYAPLSDKIARAFEYLLTTDLQLLPSGKYDIDEDLFAIVQEYGTKEAKECKPEKHEKHIDVQYVISGVELMGIAPFKNQLPVLENKESDYAFYEADTSFVKVAEGMFTIFFPDDLHMPCVKCEQSSQVKKVVVKVKV